MFPAESLSRLERMRDITSHGQLWKATSEVMVAMIGTWSRSILLTVSFRHLAKGRQPKVIRVVVVVIGQLMDGTVLVHCKHNPFIFSFRDGVSDARLDRFCFGRLFWTVQKNKILDKPRLGIIHSIEHDKVHWMEYRLGVIRA